MIDIPLTQRLLTEEQAQRIKGSIPEFIRGAKIRVTIGSQRGRGGVVIQVWRETNLALVALPEEIGVTRLVIALNGLVIADRA